MIPSAGRYSGSGSWLLATWTQSGDSSQPTSSSARTATSGTFWHAVNETVSKKCCLLAQLLLSTVFAISFMLDVRPLTGQSIPEIG